MRLLLAILALALCTSSALLFGAGSAAAQSPSIDRIVIASGTRTNGAVRRVVRPQLREIRRCMRPTQYWAIDLRLEIDASGRVTSAQASGRRLGDEAKACIETAASTWTFAASDEPTRTRLEIAVGLGTYPIGPDQNRPAPITVRVAAPTVDGALDREVARRVIRRALNQFRYCHELGLRYDPALHGTVEIEMVVDAEGRVTGTRLVSSTLPEGHDVPACMAARAARLTFPSAASVSRIVQRFILVGLD